MSFLKWIRVLHGQRVVVYRDAQPVEMLRPGRYLRVAVGGGLEIERFSTRDPWVVTHMLPEIVRAGLLEGEAVVLDLVDRERAIVRIDGRYAGVKGKGVSAVWTAERKVEVERYEMGFALPSNGERVTDFASFRLDHPSLAVIVELPGAKSELDVALVPAGSTGLVFRDGKLVRIDKPDETCKELARLVNQGAIIVQLAVQNLRELHKVGDTHHQFVVDINSMENEADSVYDKALERLFATEKDAIELIKKRDLYSTLELATDKCEDVANVLESIMLKYA